MNFLEAFEELDQLNEVNLEHQIRARLSYKYNNGKCPGCGKQFGKDGKDEYNRHLANECEDKAVRKVFNELPARVKVGHDGRTWDILTNINAGDFREYVKMHDKCEICGSNDRLRPDHSHPANGSNEGIFRGVLCEKCNHLLGKIEARVAAQNIVALDDYVDALNTYLHRSQKWYVSLLPELDENI